MLCIIIWILIITFSWILLTPQQEGIKMKKIGKSIAKTTTTATKAVAKTTTTATKAVANTANQVGSAIAKVATSGMDNNTKMVLKNMKKIKKALGSFIAKSKGYIPIPIPPSMPLVARNCGV